MLVSDNVFSARHFAREVGICMYQDQRLQALAFLGTQFSGLNFTTDFSTTILLADIEPTIQKT